jgi:putative phosphoribosyl transferase
LAGLSRLAMHILTFVNAVEPYESTVVLLGSRKGGQPVSQSQVSWGIPHDVTIGPKQLKGILTIPEPVIGLVMFSHGSGSSRLSPRNTYVAEKLQNRAIATLLFDLLTEEEASNRRNVFHIPLLAARLEQALVWTREDPETAALPVGLFGGSTGSAAALVTAAQNPREIAAIVSRGGRPDMAGAALAQIQAPTLLIVGGADISVLELNKDAYAELKCTKHLHIVPDATHLFEEPGTLDEVVEAAGAWFTQHFQAKEN